MGKPLEIVTEEPAPTTPKPKLVKPEQKQDPGFWTRPAIQMGWGKTGKQIRNFPDKLSDDARAGLYPVDFTDGTLGQHLTGSATAPKEVKTVPAEAEPKEAEAKESKEVEPQKAKEKP